MPSPKKKTAKTRKSVSPQKRADSFLKFFSLRERAQGSEKEKARRENQKDIRKGVRPGTTAKPGQGTLNRMKRKRQGKRT